MRRIAPILAIATLALGAAASRSHANNLTITLRESAPARAPACGAPARHVGLFGLHRKAAGPRLVYERTLIVENLLKPCPTGPIPPDGGYGPGKCRCPRRLAAIGRLIHHQPPHCIPWCYTGIHPPCSCCDHDLKPIRPGTPRHLFYAAMIRSGMLPAYPAR